MCVKTYGVSSILLLLVPLLFLFIPFISQASSMPDFWMENYPGTAFDLRATNNPSNPAALSDIDKVHIPREKPAVTLFIQTRAGRQIIDMPDDKEEHSLEITPIWRGPYMFSFYSSMYVSDSHALESALISSQAFNEYNLKELEGEEGSKFYKALADMINRIPFSADGMMGAYASGRRFRLSAMLFANFLACYTEEPRYYFLTEEGQVISVSTGKYLGTKNLRMAGGVNVKYIEQKKDQIIFDDDFSINAVKAEGAGAGIDMGILIKLSNSLNFGVVFENIVSQVNWSGQTGKLGFNNDTQVDDYNEIMSQPFSIKVGIADITEDRIMAADFEFKPASLIPSDFSTFHFIYGRSYLDNRLSLSVKGFSDIKNKLVAGVNAGYRLGLGKIQINLGSSDAFSTSFEAGASLSIVF